MIIGISGKIGTGKTTLAKLLEEMLGAECYSLGGLLKQEVAERFDFDLGLCYSQSGKDTHILHPDLLNGCMSVREILQWWGTDVRRREDSMYWSRLMREEIEQSNAEHIAIDDVRYPDEAWLVISKGGLLVRMQPYPGWEPGPYANHESETALDYWIDWDLVCAPMYGELPQIADEVVREVHARGGQTFWSRR